MNLKLLLGLYVIALSYFSLRQNMDLGRFNLMAPSEISKMGHGQQEFNYSAAEINPEDEQSEETDEADEEYREEYDESEIMSVEREGPDQNGELNSEESGKVDALTELEKEEKRTDKKGKSTGSGLAQKSKKHWWQFWLK